MSMTPIISPVTPQARREMAFTTFGAGYQSVWRERLVAPGRVVPMANQHGTADIQQTTVLGNNRSAAKPGSPPRREPR